MDSELQVAGNGNGEMQQTGGAPYCHTPLGLVWGTLPNDPRERLAYISGLTGDEAVKGDDLPGQVFEAVSYLVHPVEMVDEHSGEVITHNRLVIRAADGLPYSTLSPHALQSWGMVVATLGHGPYDPPVPCEFREGKSRRGMKFRTLVVLNGGGKK